MLELLWKYLIGPIIADARGMKTLAWKGATASTGYNPVNTVIYAATASIILYAIYRLFQEKNVQITPTTAVHSTPFILLGGTLRFLDDAQLVPYPFSIALITPPIYILIASIYIPAVYKLENKNLLNLGAAILLPTLGYALTGFNAFNLVYTASTIFLSTALTAAYYFIVKEEYKITPLVLLAFTQFFEGAASMISTFYGYQPKQLLAQLFNSFLGFPGVLVMKATVLGLAVSVIKDIEDQTTKSVVLLTLYAVGLGTGFRVFLRVIAGA